MRKLVMVLLGNVLLLLSLAIPAWATPDVENAIVQVDLTFPAGQRALGVLTVVRDPSPSGAETNWSFVGTVDGLPASGKGTAVENWSSETYCDITLKTIDQWNSQLPRPAVGTKYPMRHVGNVMYVRDAPLTFPIALSQPMLPPVEGGFLQLTLTNLAAAPAIVQVLPATGDTTPILLWPAAALFGAVLLAVGLKLPSTSHSIG